MLAHCHCSKNGGATYVLLDNNNVENIAQEMVRLLFVLYRSPLPHQSLLPITVNWWGGGSSDEKTSSQIFC